MKTFFKIVLILLAVFPLWVTIMAMATTTMPSNAWKQAINKQLLNQATATRRMQVVQFSSTPELLDETMLTEKFDVEVIDTRSSSYMPIQLKFLDSEKRLNRLIKLSAKILIEELATVSARSITQGEFVQEADLTTAWTNITRFGNSRPLSATEITGRKTRVNLRENSPITSNQIDIPALIRAGDRVEIRIVGNSLSVSSFGIAKEPGDQGQTIKVVNPESRKEIYGTVTGAKKVEVRL